MIILIDCPPSLVCAVMALVSSNSLLVPLQTDFALEGLTQLMKTIERIKVNLNLI